MKRLTVVGDGEGTHTEILAFPLRSFARTWAAELSDRKIRVNAVSPRTIQTPNLDTMRLDELRGAILTRFPMSSVGEAGEVARAVLFLPSNERSSIGIDFCRDPSSTSPEAIAKPQDFPSLSARSLLC